MSMLESLKETDSLSDVAALLGYKPSSLSYIIHKLPADQKYQSFKIPKKDGGLRKIDAPIDKLKTLQRRIANILYACRDQIDSESNLNPISHGFRRNLSIISNAKPHQGRRYVLNLDLQDFFPSFNFGRVRGYFIKNKHFELNEDVATVIAQIACYQNSLPQGSPCSPIIADMIAQILDVRLVQLAKKYRLTYSRYADDLTFSTNQKTFPTEIAQRTGESGPEWILGPSLISSVSKCGFSVNTTKTRMQYRNSRQLVTGLTVNKKVNIRPEYYRQARAMCHSLFQSGKYSRVPATDLKSESNSDETLTMTDALHPLEGILNHIHYVKDSIDRRSEVAKKDDPTAARTLYTQLLRFRYFVMLDRPLIICEGKTDNVYLKFAIRNLTSFHPTLGEWIDTKFTSAVSFFSYTNVAHKILNLYGGSGDLHYLLVSYNRILKRFKHRPLKHPVIVLIDNDGGAKSLFKEVNKQYGLSISVTSKEPFYFITDNLYLVKTPENGKSTGTCIEDLFDDSTRATKINGKSFNPSKSFESNSEYGKVVFAEQVVRANAETLNFAGFTQLLQRIVAVIEHYKSVHIS